MTNCGDLFRVISKSFLRLDATTSKLSQDGPKSEKEKKYSSSSEESQILRLQKNNRRKSVSHKRQLKKNKPYMVEYVEVCC